MSEESLADMLDEEDDTDHGRGATEPVEGKVVTLRSIDAESTSLRPVSFSEIIGQDHIKDPLQRYISAANQRGVTLDHVLLSGQAGLGKTALAGATANALNAPVIHLTGPQLSITTIEEALVSTIINKIQESGRLVVFIDEIHGVDKMTMTVMLPLVEDFRFRDQVLPPFTLIGATTDPAKLLAPFRNRFQITFDLEFYTEEEIREIMLRYLRRKLDISAKAAEMMITDQEAFTGLSKRARGVPRRAEHLILRMLDFMLQPDNSYTPITAEIVKQTCTALRLDEYGLEYKDRLLLVAMLRRYHGRHVGVRSLAAAIGETVANLEGLIEPDLVRMGFILREPRGRTLSPLGIRVATEALKSGERFPI